LNLKTFLNGGQGGIRTPVTIAGQPDFESGALNRALPPVRSNQIRKPALNRFSIMVENGAVLNRYFPE
jgi:hypothetical protein